MNERDYKLDPLARMRALDEAQRILESQDAKLDELASLQDDCIEILNRSNREAERFARTDPARHGGFFWWLLVFATFAVLSGAVFNASRAGATSPVNNCIEALVEDINPALMSDTTARRKARVLCYDIRYNDRTFYKALTQ